MKGKLFQSTITGAVLIGITALIYLYTSGYRISKETSRPIDFKQTGMINVKSIPDGASVYVNDVLKAATNNSIPSLNPGTYKLKIVKSGFIPWEKDIEVFQELVTDITAVLVSGSPSFEPLTNTGARYPVVSPSLSKLAYFTNDLNAPGIWIIPLTQSGINLFKSTPSIAIENTARTLFSLGKSIEWSPDETELLVQDDKDIYHLIDIETRTSQTTESPDTIRERWLSELLKKREDFIQKIDISDDFAQMAKSIDSLWSPDGKKFMYIQENGDQLEYKTYNMEKPLPIGEKKDTLVFTIDKNSPQPIISWYADSYHLILVENYDQESKSGSIYLVRIDGSNKTLLYSGKLYSSNVYSAPSGDKIIILTSFKSDEEVNLYTIGIR
ncbi:PEGA domain-containing protein [Candidatus Nomurabacteria bacterium]|uniref:PEGA domain-containing protein n=1 Tax=candidate division WWE3 bacterium TaxID=2053526 RepID=A0A955E0X1_UNCKA|nr:PEGA domain-containing protein [candidate division WWE3 bacterium]MCB9823610.1 PEGA domain-containing protein [Candidatus Nomurabacteria bacterium]MCB9827405.1 PEGA domain-containing protein [Candidatus Nomurabacteria bacterium]HXK52648.1 PEGA domain-containing protein [bacterium]